MIVQADKLHQAWAMLAHSLVRDGQRVSPRGKETREIEDVSLRFDGRQNVIVNPTRDLNYRFMVAEWLWISLGRNDVGSIARFNKQIAQFSDDGVRFAGAYGPPLRDQLPYLAKNLKNDDTSRQAVLTIWRPNPGPSKDIPCTVALQFKIRKDKLNVTATMRSSDVWLGVPYDAFNFSQIGNALAGALGVEMGRVVMNLCSSHVYAPNYDGAHDAVMDGAAETVASPTLAGWPVSHLNTALDGDPIPQGSMCAPNAPGEWPRYAAVLAAPNKARALEILRG